jgi:phosphoesterase RecJ-like protein
MKNIKEIVDWSQKIAIFCHENPDWDAIWSILWFWKLLEKLWKDVFYFSPDKPSKMFSFLQWFEKIKYKFDYWYYNLIIFLDFSEYSRLWKVFKDRRTYFIENNILVLDHHRIKDIPKNRTIFNDTKATSTCEIILENTLDIWESYYDEEIATYLYLWLTTDSWNFRYDDNHERILKNALTLIQLWANKKLIIDNLINNKSLWSIRFLKTLLDRLTKEWDILYTYYDKDELENYDIDNEQASYWLSILQEIKWPKIIMTIRKEWKIAKWSLRSKDTDVENIAKQFWWWWHIHASWFSIEIKNNFEKTKNSIIKNIKSLLA